MIGRALNLLLMAAFLTLFYLFSEGRAVQVLTNPLLAFGLILAGAFLSALISGRVRVTGTRYPHGMVQGLAGGLLMGIGFSLALLPPLGNMLMMVSGVFYWVSFLMPQGFIYLVGMFLGGALAAFSQKRYYSRVRLTPLSRNAQENIEKGASLVLPILGLLLSAGVVKVLLSGDMVWWIGLSWAMAAVLGGFLLERNRICMGLMMKELFLTKSKETLVKVTFITIFLAVTWRFLAVTGPASLPMSWLTLTGSFLMGFGYILADGCFMGSLWKSGQGNLTSYLTLLGIILGAGLSSFAQGSMNSVSRAITLNLGPSRVASLLVEWPETAVLLGLVLLISVWIGAYFLELPKKVVRSGSKIKWLLSEAAILFTGLATAFAPRIPTPWELRVLGLVLFYAAVTLYIWARISLGGNWGEAIVLREDHKIVTGGPYRLVKHPIYIAIITGLTGLGFLLGSLWVMAGTYLLALPTIILRAKEEERLLSELQGGKDYFK